ncbi:hypothetical protein B5T_02929 [Alloalcanivorax dieselolei B5]|uniref:Uncharacterized protein n=1 Tax=Alcanivorax dieselolei (strain DSM 16502 / CGMCC 1.3690 / MCCC 1A00001 / B-5) TaxID=930169 RepID=K0CHL2_ALCDB|nr:hypothetical protein B5T_02929 [Alloalcanivorax dieselolei B5]GGJ93851.1 hypothetical protein GCM10007426_23530 [Alloalcanivorax dieselolei]
MLMPSCSFSEEDAPPILYATGVVASNEPSQGIVKVSGYVERIGAPGGVAGITGDPTFTGRGKTISIAIRGPAIGGGESPPRPATLTYERADGGKPFLRGNLAVRSVTNGLVSRRGWSQVLA